jgi:hypothetical protein
MIDDQRILNECFVFFFHNATNLLFVLSKEGKIIEANHYAKNIAGKDVIGSHIRDVVVDFSETFELDALLNNHSKEHLMNIITSSGSPQTFYFTFKSVTGYILAFGRLDAEELDAMQKEVSALNSELSNLTRELNKKNAHLQDALDHIKTLQGILPICMHCHQIRNDQQVWEKLEAYLSAHSEAEFSHSICPQCAKKYYPDMDLYDE